MEDNTDAGSLAEEAAAEPMSVDEDEVEVVPSADQIQCLCRILRRADHARKEIDILKTIFSWPDEQWEKITNYLENGGVVPTNTVPNPYDNKRKADVNSTLMQSKRGRPKGSKNKKGHGAGGNQYHAKVQCKTPAKGQQTLAEMMNQSDNNDDVDDNSNIVGGDDTSQVIEDAAYQKREDERMAAAVKQLEIYVNSIPNGTMVSTPDAADDDDSLDLNSDDDEDSDSDDEQSDIRQLCKHFLAKSDIFPKLPTLIKPGMKRWEINEAIRLLGLETEEAFNELFEQLRTVVSLPPPAAQAAATAEPVGANTTTNNGVTDRLPPVHVGPVPTVGQTQFVPTADVNSRCKWWPICTAKQSDCGGTRKNQCKYYGRRGTKQPPSKQEFDRQFRLHSWDQKALQRNCTYYPFCKKKQWDCGGCTLANCTTFKPLGTKDPPTKDEFDKAKREMRRKVEAARLAAKRAARASAVSNER